MVEANLFLLGVKETAEIERSALIRLRNEFSEGLEGLKTTLAQHTSKVASWEKSSIASLKESKKTWSDDLTAIRKQHDDLLRLYRDQLGLQAPVLYWTSKRKNHIALALLAGAVFLLLVVATVYGLWQFGDLLQQRVPGKFSEIPAGLYLLFGVPAFLSIWLLRITSRIFLTNLGLQADAQERVAMINTFLSLSQDKKVSDEDRSLILGALFHPGGQATADDGAPPSWFDFVLSRLGGSK
jgi:hypothetical protein